MIRAVVCDLGGVVIRIDTSRISAGWAHLSGRPAAEVHAAFPNELDEAFERGELSEDAYFDQVRARLGVAGTDEHLRAVFSDLYLGVDRQTLDVLQRVREHGVLLLALTNTNRAHHRVWSHRFAEALHVFHQVYCSHELGHRKPEPQAFRAVLDEHRIDPGDAVFIDDTPGHVAAAQKIGLHGIVFTDAASLAERLATFDLPQPNDPPAR